MCLFPCISYHLGCGVHSEPPVSLRWTTQDKKGKAVGYPAFVGIITVNIDQYVVGENTLFLWRGMNYIEIYI